MSPLFMDTGYEPNSPGSLSAEESHSNTAGSEREGEGQQTGKRGTKRQEKNRDAARKSRRKQTERADVLHEELQSLEQANSALQKEIASLKRDLHLYTTALERHEPFCCLQDSASSSVTRFSVSPSADSQTGSSPPGIPSQASNSTQAAPSSLSTSLTSSLGLPSTDCIGSPHLSSPASTTTTLASSSDSPSEPFTSSSSVTAPYSVSFSTVTASHSLFNSDPLSLITSRPTQVTPVCTGLVSNPVPTSSLTTTAQPRQDAIHKHPSMSANGCFSPLHPSAVDTFLMKHSSFLTASSNVVPPYSHLENAGLVAQGCPMNVPQLHPVRFNGNPINSSPPSSLLPSTLLDPAPQSLSVSPQANLEPSPASAFAPKPSYSGHVAPNPASLLSLLTVPSPLNESQTTSSIFDGLLPQTLPPLTPLGDSSRDLSLSELLEVNDWILQ